MTIAILHPLGTRRGNRLVGIHCLAATLCAALAGCAVAQDTATDDDPRSKDRDAIRAAMDSFVEAFEARDPKRLAAHWTEEGEFENAAGLSMQGRDKLEAGFTAIFEKTPEVTAKLQPESLRFLSSDTAIDEGTATVQRGPAVPATTTYYSALLVRDGDTWRLARLSESSADDEPAIEDLAWLVGEWKSLDGQGAEIRTTYAWNANQTFLQVRFSLKEDSLSAGGAQMIGIDPETGGIRTWTFEDRGGVGEADWTRDGQHWVLDAVGTLPDGRTLIQTNILRRVNDDLFTWQSIDRTLDGEPLADLAPVKVERVAPKSAEPAKSAAK